MGAARTRELRPSGKVVIRRIEVTMQ